MSSILVFLTTGFEEIEALGTVDVLRRAGLAVQTVSLEGERQVVGAHGVPVLADALFDEVECAAASMLVVPGGTTRYAEHEGLKQQLLAFAQAGGRVAAICASPAVLGRAATCYPGFEAGCTGAVMQTGKAVVVDGNITTGRGPGLALEFALTLVEQVAGTGKRAEVAKGLLLA